MPVDYKQAVLEVREAFNSGRTRDVDFRKHQLRQLKRMYEENKDRIVLALAEDLRKPKQEAILTEVKFLLEDIDFHLANVDEFSKTKIVPCSTLTLFDKCRIYRDPYGVVLVMGAWNYPFQLTMLPVSGAIAAGNCVVIKPSEISSSSASLLEELMPKYVDRECYRVICGGIPETTELLKEKFDYIFYTGSTNVGRIVRGAANAHLTPAVLELGGKSPVYIDDTVDMEVAARRIMWGKLLNSGQTCIAPDYLLCSKTVQDNFIATAKKVIKEFYGEGDPQNSPDMGRIVNDRNFNRIIEYIKDGKPAIGGTYDAKERWIAPTILTGVSLNSKIMQEEIFGPILPIVNVESPKEVINIVNSRDKPLAFYAFTNNVSKQELFLREIPFGGGCINDCILHTSTANLPFGGVGPSGMGSYHGKASFDTFTYNKSVMIRNYNSTAESLSSARYPPYSQKSINRLLMLKEYQLPPIEWLYYLAAFALGVISICLYERIC